MQYHLKDSLQKLLIQENYPKVIQLISECQKASEIYKNYDCIIGLHSDLNDILEQVEENLDSSLSKICNNFDVHNYASIQIAYNFLNKSETAIDQLHMHFTAAVHNTSYTTVVNYATSEAETQYYNLCKIIPQEHFFSCLFDLCTKLIAILKSYFLVIKWHNDNYNQAINIVFDHPVEKTNKKYILQKLEHGIMKICNDIDNKISGFINEFDLTFLKFEEFIQVLSMIDRYFQHLFIFLK